MYVYEQIYVCICIISLEYHIGLFENRDNQRWKALDMAYQSLYFFLNIAQQFSSMKLRKIPRIKLFFYFLFVFLNHIIGSNVREPCGILPCTNILFFHSATKAGALPFVAEWQNSVFAQGRKPHQNGGVVERKVLIPDNAHCSQGSRVRNTNHARTEGE